MLHAPVAERKGGPEATRTAVPPGRWRELLSREALVAARGPAAVRSQHFLGLQRTLGNQAVLRMLSRGAPAIQTKLTVNQPGDQYEQEADRVADQVMRMPEPVASPEPPPESGGATGLYRKCSQCEEEKVQREEAGEGPAVAPPIVHEVLRSTGQPLP